MPKDSVFTMKLASDLRTEFMAAAEASHRPASQVVRELMREYVQRQQEQGDHASFMQEKVDAARVSVQNEKGRSNEMVKADFAAHRARAGQA